jgi:hypothetical protein
MDQLELGFSSFLCLEFACFPAAVDPLVVFDGMPKQSKQTWKQCLNGGFFGQMKKQVENCNFTKAQLL